MDKNLVIDDVVKKIDTEKNIKEKYFSKMVIVPLISLAIGVFGSIMKINTSLLISLIGGTFLLKGGYSYYKYQKHRGVGLYYQKKLLELDMDLLEDNKSDYLNMVYEQKNYYKKLIKGVKDLAVGELIVFLGVLGCAFITLSTHVFIGYLLGIIFTITGFYDFNSFMNSLRDMLQANDEMKIRGVFLEENENIDNEVNKEVELTKKIDSKDIEYDKVDILNRDNDVDREYNNREEDNIKCKKRVLRKDNNYKRK